MATTYTNAVSVDMSVNYTEWIYYATAPASGPLTVTVTVSAATANQFYGVLLEYAGVSAIRMESAKARRDQPATAYWWNHASGGLLTVPYLAPSIERASREASPARAAAEGDLVEAANSNPLWMP
jgi:hypothetical protein